MAFTCVRYPAYDDIYEESTVPNEPDLIPQEEESASESVIITLKYHEFKDIQQLRPIVNSPIYLTPNGARDHELYKEWERQELNKPYFDELRALQAHMILPTSNDKLAWPKDSHHWYPYTPASGLTHGERVDPNVLLAIRHCPQLQDGSYCLDPTYPASVIDKAIARQRPPSLLQRMKRKYKFLWEEHTWNLLPPLTDLTIYENMITPAWQPCYQMHRVQRISANDPCLSLIENYVLRMQISIKNAPYYHLFQGVNAQVTRRIQEDVQPL